MLDKSDKQWHLSENIVYSARLLREVPRRPADTTLNNTTDTKEKTEMTKVEFVEKYAEKTGMSKKDAAAAVKAFFEVTADALKAGDKVVFPGTFKAEVTERAERTGRNPITGAEMVIPAKKVIKVKFSDKLLG